MRIPRPVALIGALALAATFLAPAVANAAPSSATTASAPIPSYNYLCVDKKNPTKQRLSTGSCGFGERREPWTTTPVGNKKLGPVGPAGPMGPVGPQGPKGDTGAAGANGLKGADGTDGLKGADGAQGPAGAAGLPGKQGPKGNQGNRGPKGDKGANGANGAAVAEKMTLNVGHLNIPGLTTITLCNSSSDPKHPVFGKCGGFTPDLPPTPVPVVTPTP